MILASWYMLRLHQGLMHDPPKPRTEGVHDLHIGEALLLVPLVALMIFIGLWPKPITDVSKGSVSTYVAMVQPTRGPGRSVMFIAASPVPLTFPGGYDLIGILPELVLGGAFLLLMLLDLVIPAVATDAGSLDSRCSVSRRRSWSRSSAGTTPTPGRLVYSGSFAYDRFALFVDAILLVSAGLVIMISPHYLNRRGMHYGEYYALILAATVGMMLLAGASSLMVIFLAIELLSLALYVLSGFARHEERSQEAALKYLLLGGFASGFLLFGMALIYGETGHTQLAQIAAAIQAREGIDPLLLAGVILLFIGFAFKVSAAPFHSWTPDVYQGAPTSVTTFMSVTTKVAAFAALVRVFTYTFDGGDATSTRTGSRWSRSSPSPRW